MRMSRKGGRLHGPESGMTLIEVLLAAVILSISAGVLLTAVSRGLAVVRRGRQFETARRLLYQAELEFPVNRTDIYASEPGGWFETPDGWRWEREIEAVDEERRPGLYEVRMRVYWSDRGAESFEETVTRHFLSGLEP